MPLSINVEGASSAGKAKLRHKVARRGRECSAARSSVRSTFGNNVSTAGRKSRISQPNSKRPRCRPFNPVASQAPDGAAQQQDFCGARIGCAFDDGQMSVANCPVSADLFERDHRGQEI